MASEVAGPAGRQVALAGWTHRVRRIGAVTFVVLRDASGLVQLVLEGGTAPAAAAVDLGAEDVIRVVGEVRVEPRAPGGHEIAVTSLQVVSRAGPLPFEINLPTLKAGLDLALDHRVLSLRHPRSQAIFRVKAEITRAFRDFSVRHGFLEVQTPKIVATATEGGANLFPVDYLGRRAYLAQSPQLYKQMLVLSGFERVFEVGPVYRAEPHHTARHLNEFTSLDWEAGFVASASELMDLEETMLREMVGRLSDGRSRELGLLEADPAAKLGLGDGGRPARLTLAEARRLLQVRRGKESPAGDLDPEGERLLCELVGGATFVTDYPAASRPAYAHPREDDPELTDTFDLLVGGIEVTTGGRRISDRAALEASLQRRGLDPRAFGFYLEGFGYGAPPHGGLAIGAERLTAALLGLGNLREATFFPRDTARLEP